MRTVDEPTVLPAANCSACKQAPWTKWCRGCNLVFCDAHIERTLHACVHRDAPPPPDNTAEECTQTCVEAPAPENGTSVSVQMPMQLEIFTTPPPEPDPPAPPKP